MSYYRVLLTIIPLILITACTTQKALKETGKEIDKGNYGVAAWYTITLPIVMIYDVFTLGGTSDVNSGTSTLSSVASNVSPNSNAAKTLSTMASSSTQLSSVSHTNEVPQMTQASERVQTTKPVDLSTFKPEDFLGQGGRCEKNLAYLSNRLPLRSPPEIGNIRDEIVKSDLHSIMLAINKEGVSPDKAIEQNLLQAAEYDRTTQDALKTAAQTDGMGITQAQFSNQITSGTLQVNSCDGVRNAALCAAIINSYGAIASRAVAANLMCYKRTNQWPKA